MSTAWKNFWLVLGLAVALTGCSLSMTGDIVPPADTANIPGAGGPALAIPDRSKTGNVSDAVLVVDRLHLFIQRLDEQTVRVVELFIISNISSAAVTARQANGPNVSFILPPNASNLQFLNSRLGERYLATADGFADTIPVEPGQGSYQVLFAFDLAFNRQVDLAQPLNLPVTALVILSPEDAYRLKGAGLADDGRQIVQGQAFRQYSRAALQSGEVLQFSIHEPPLYQRLAVDPDDSTRALGIAVLGIAIGVVGILYFRRLSRPTGAGSRGLPCAAVDNSSEALLDAILTLDDLHKAGKLNGEAYQKRRQELKDRLKACLAEEQP